MKIALKLNISACVVSVLGHCAHDETGGAKPYSISFICIFFRPVDSIG